MPFYPRPVFGRLRAPEIVTFNGYSYRSALAAVGDQFRLPLRKSNRKASGPAGGETLEVTLALDRQHRSVQLPADRAEALARSGVAAENWQRLSYSHQRENVDAIAGAKKPEMRARWFEAIM